MFGDNPLYEPVYLLIIPAFVDSKKVKSRVQFELTIKLNPYKAGKPKFQRKYKDGIKGVESSETLIPTRRIYERGIIAVHMVSDDDSLMNMKLWHSYNELTEKYLIFV